MEIKEFVFRNFEKYMPTEEEKEIMKKILESNKEENEEKK